MEKSIQYILFIVLIIILSTGCSKSTLPNNPPTTQIPMNLNTGETPEKNNTTTEIPAENTIVMSTNVGNITLRLFTKDAPKTVQNFLTLARQNFYDGIKFHRVIKGFMIQSGDPNSKDNDWSNDGIGGPGYYFADEINPHKLVAGTLAMANSGPNTNGSQFFIVTAESAPWLDGMHTAFGEVVDGMDAVRVIESSPTDQSKYKDHPLKDIIINDIQIPK